MKNTLFKFQIKLFIFLILFFFLIFNFRYQIPTVFAAELSLETNGNSFTIGSIFKAVVRLNVSLNESVNALEVYLKYPPQLVSLEKVSFGNSILIPINEPIIDKKEGIVSFSGIIPGGYSEIIKSEELPPSNLIATLYFKVLKPGFTEIEFLKNCRVLLNDGLGTPAKLMTKNIGLSFLPSSSLKQPLNELSSDIKEDKNPPLITQLQVVKVLNTSYLVFNAVDKESGIDHYEVKPFSLLLSALNLSKWVKANSPYKIPNLPCLFKLTVKAIDNAGNETIASISLPTALVLSRFLICGIILIILLFIFILGIKKWRKQRR